MSDWRNDPPTDPQLELLNEIGIHRIPDTKGEASNLISAHFDPIENAVLAAIKQRLGLEIIYRGGSNPGGRRHIVPIEVSGGYVKAIDPVTTEAKTFKLTRIELADGGELVDVGFNVGIKTKKAFTQLGWSIDSNTPVFHVKSHDGKSEAHLIINYDNWEKPFKLTGTMLKRARSYKSINSALTSMLDIVGKNSVLEQISNSPKPSPKQPQPIATHTPKHAHIEDDASNTRMIVKLGLPVLVLIVLFILGNEI